MRQKTATAKAAESTPPVAGTQAPATTAWSRLRENVEAIIVAIVLALIIRHYSLEAFEIPTGSMAPGLHGVHVDTQCPNCDTRDSVGIQTHPQTGAAEVDWEDLFVYVGKCPDCGCRVEDLTGKSGVPTRCPNCQQHRPSDPTAFRKPEVGFSLMAAWQSTTTFNRVLIGVAVFIALSVRRRTAAIAAWCAVVAVSSYAPITLYKSLIPKAAKISNLCSECGFRYDTVYEPSDCRGGHKILVNKFLYELRAPRRWEVIVFKFNRQRNYIKRLIGLPGERIRVMDGDLWTAQVPNAPLEVERKPEWAQDQLWFTVHDSAIVERGYVEPAWKRSSGWVEDEGSTDIQFNALGDSAELSYQRPITNRVAYNAIRPGTYQRVFDLRLAANVTVGGGNGSVDLQVVNGGRTFRCVIPVEGSENGLEAGQLGILVSRQEQGGEVTTQLAALGPDVRLTRNREHLVDFYRADGHLVVRLDGKIAGEVAIPEEFRENLGESENTVRLVGHGIGGTLHRIRVFRDIFYTSDDPRGLPHATVSVYEIPDNGYFAMGDNSSSSLDSRNWGHLSSDNMLGRAFAIFWPKIGFIR